MAQGGWGGGGLGTYLEPALINLFILLRPALIRIGANLSFHGNHYSNREIGLLLSLVSWA